MKVIDSRKTWAVYHVKCDCPTGECDRCRRSTRIGVKIVLDCGVEVGYSLGNGTFSVTYPDTPTFYRTGRPDGGIKKGTRYTGLSQARFIREFGAAMVLTSLIGLQEADPETVWF